MLIAIVSDINTDVTETAEVEVRKLRTQRIIDEDALMSKHERTDPGCFPEFLEILQARPPDNPPSKVEKRIDAVETKLGQVEANMNAKVDELKAMMAQLLAQP